MNKGTRAEARVQGPLPLATMSMFLADHWLGGAWVRSATTPPRAFRLDGRSGALPVPIVRRRAVNVTTRQLQGPAK